MILRLSKDSFRTIFAVSLVMPSLIRDPIQNYHYDTDEIVNSEEIASSTAPFTGSHYTLGSFMPGQSTQKSLLQQKCVRLFEK